MPTYSYDASGNSVGLAPSGVAAPRIMSQPVSQVVGPGDFATLSVVVADARGVTFQWRFSGEDIPGATGDSVLLTPNAIAANERRRLLHIRGILVALYYVVVRNSAGWVVSTLVEVRLDIDGDGLPDNWETRQFGNTAAERGAGDFDGDGISNLDELIDRTDPTNKASGRPRLTAYSDAGGSVTVTPMKLSYDLGESVTLTPLAFPPSVFVGWGGDLDGTNDPATVTMDRNKTVVAKFASPAPLASGLIALWQGETDASDLIGGHHGAFFAGTVASAPRVTQSGKVGAAFDLDGTVHIRVPSAAALQPTAITLEGWIFPTAATTRSQMVIAYGSAEHGGNSYHLSLVNQRARFFTKPHLEMEAVPQIPLNQWTHLAATCDGTAKCLYINGAQEAFQSGLLVPIIYDGAPVPVTIGSDWEFGASANAFHGRIDELAIYDRALSADEIKGIYNADVVGKNLTAPYFISASPLPNAALGSPYIQQIRTVLGKAPVSLSLTGGALPPAMSLSPAGVVSGVSGLKGTFDFTVRATDAVGGSTDKLFVLKVV